ncbi:MAG: hypothetical protein K6T91_06420 [Firmicutes bacterium]|nr:hypothetical protein [Bacillota bacterium]
MAKIQTKGKYHGDITKQIRAFAVLAVSLVIFVGVSIQFSARYGSPCSICHAARQQTVSWRSSPHHSVSCLACHQDTGYFSFLKTELKAGRNFTTWLFRSYQDPIVASVGNDSCLVCHSREVKHTIISKGIRVSHKEFSGYLCTSCHADIAHQIKGRIRNQADMDSCSGCHNYTEGDVTCEKCHPKNAETEKLASGGPWKLTHGPGWKALHGMGDPKTCTTCHDDNFCMGCHQSPVPHTKPWSYLHPAAAKQNVNGCYQCHKKSLCNDCHRIEMPHPEGFLKEHEFMVKDRGYDLCWRCHLPEACVSCHTKAAHTNTPGKKFAPGHKSP